MIPRTHIASARIPNGPEMHLYARGGDHMILVDRDELMSTRMSGSEEALAIMTADLLGNRPKQRWLIGGYGMGFTLRAALRSLPKDAEVTVAELVPQIIDWARGPMAELTAGGLDDPRTRLVIGDVGGEIAKGGWDAILLDVDNGPDALVRPDNDRLYAAGGLHAAKAALRLGGLLAIWSAGADPRFTKALHAAGFQVDEQVVRARQNGKGPRHVIWFAEKR
jgi:spermidine synthase